MATPEDPSTDRVDVKAALWAFGRRYLHALESQDAPMRSIAIGGWRAHPQAADLFMPLETRLPPSRIGEWVEYRAIEALVTSRPRLRRLITEPMYAPTDQVPDFNGLLSGVVGLPIERYEAIHGADEHGLAELIDELADWFCRDADPMFVATSVVGCIGPGPLTLAPGITVRRATDEEASAMLEIGALNLDSSPNRPQIYTMHIHEAARWIVALDFSRPRQFGRPAQKEDEPDLAALASAASAWLAVLRILTPAQVRLGPTFTRQLVGGVATGGWSNGYGPSAMFAWHKPATVPQDKAAQFTALGQEILGGKGQRLGIEHGLHRFSDATARTSMTDRLVDLVIALESMFSKSAGSASYQVSRCASAIVANLGLSASAIYQFVSAAYESRSKIVHGGTPAHENLAGQPCAVDEQVLQLDRLIAAIFRRILSSSSNEKPAVVADRLINAALDSQIDPLISSESATYDVTVRHDGTSFTAVPRDDFTFRVRAATPEDLRDRVADVLALWTQAPCASDQVILDLEDDARAAMS